ncbi:MAG: DUF1801 domain-containing protein [Leucobacter sp.]
MSEKIDGFLRSLEEQADERHGIIARMRELVTTTYPGLEETFQYGGLLYKDGSFLFTGLFARSNHVTVELGGGAYIDDPYGHLEGKGGREGRKHVKLLSADEIEDKHLAEYLSRAWETR